MSRVGTVRCSRCVFSMSYYAADTKRAHWHATLADQVLMRSGGAGSRGNVERTIFRHEYFTLTYAQTPTSQNKKINFEIVAKMECASIMFLTIK